MQGIAICKLITKKMRFMKGINRNHKNESLSELATYIMDNVYEFNSRSLYD